MTTVAAAPPNAIASLRAAGARLAVRAYASAKAGAATALGVGGLASVTVAAGLTDVRLGFAVGGVLAIWLASLLPGGDR